MRVLLTGAAGLIGGEVSRRLVERGHIVTALVRSNREVRGNDGAPVAVERIVTGNLAQEGAGLASEERDRLVQEHDLLLHCAAQTRFDLPDEAYRATNVEGTARALDLARAGAMDVLHVSTAYVCGARSGPILEDDPLPQGGFTNGYEASKAEAEALVRASGQRYAIARPSIVVGESETGAIRQFDTIYAAFRLIAEGRVRHMPVTHGATLDFVPLDHVARGIVALAENMERAAGGAYHLVADHPVPVESFAAAIAGFEQFHAPELVEATRFDASALPPRERRLYRRVAGLYAAYFQRDPRFDDSRFRAVTGLAAPVVDEAMLHRMIAYAIAAGFLRAA